MSVRSRFARFLLCLFTVLGVILPFSAPTALASDSSGPDYLYAGDSADGTIKRFDARTGAYLGVFATLPQDQSGPRGLIFKRGKLFVVVQNPGSTESGGVLQFSATDGAYLGAFVPAVPCTDPSQCPSALWAADGIIGGPEQTFFAADVGDQSGVPGKVTQYDATGLRLGDLQTGSYTGPWHPREMVTGPDGMLYLSVRDIDGSYGAILRFNPETRRLVDVLATTAAQNTDCSQFLHRPDGLAFGPDGRLYVAAFKTGDNDTDKILVYQGKKCVDRIDLDAVGADRTWAQSLLFGPRGYLFVPIFSTGEIRRYDVKTKTYTSFVAPGGNLGVPWAITFGQTDASTLKYGE